MTNTLTLSLIFGFSVFSVFSVANELEESPLEENPLEEELSEESTQPRFYRSPEERREAGLGTEVYEWLSISGLFELEFEKSRFTAIDNSSFSEKERPVKTIQLGLDFTFAENFEAELVLEAEDAEHSSSKIDEALISYELNDFGFTFGRMSVPFGEYYSHFVIDPMLEFGETRADSLIIDYSMNDNLELGVFWLKSDVDVRNEKVDWGLMLEWKSIDESFRFGASYLSDIAESDALLLGDFSTTALQKVAAVSANVLWGLDNFEVSAEFVKTLDKFAEFEPEYDQPQAYNLELAYFPDENLQFALRYEYSEEIEEQARERFGIGLHWLVYNNISIGLGYLKGNYKSLGVGSSEEETPEDEVLDEPEDIDVPISDEHIFAAQISLEF